MASKRFVVTGEAKVSGAVAGVERVTAALDKMSVKAEKAGKSTDKAAKLEGFVSKTTMALGVLGGGIAVMDKIFTGTARYQALMDNLPYSITGAAEATKGFMRSTELASAAIAANRGGVATTAAEFEKFSKSVMTLAMSTGQDTTEAIDVLTRALAKSETKLLDNYGIILKVEDAQRIYAESLGKSTSQLTAKERAEAFAKVGMQKINEVAEKAKINIDEYAAAWMRLKAVLTDIPALMSSAQKGIYDAMVATEEFMGLGFADEKQSFVRGAPGFLDPKNRAKQSAMRDLEAGQKERDAAMSAAMAEYIGAETDRAKAVGEMTTNRLNSMLQKANEDYVFGSKAKNKRGAKKSKWGLSQDEFGAAEVARSMDASGVQSREFMDELRSARASQVGGGLDREMGRDRAKEFEQRAEAMRVEFERERELLDIRRESKELDPLLNSSEMISQIDEQVAAKERLLDAERRLAEETLRGHERTAEIQRIEAERAEVYHRRAAARLKQEATMQRQRKQIMSGIGSSIIGVHQSIASAALQSSLNGEKFGAKQLRDMAGKGAAEMALIGTFELVKAAVAAASYNFPAAAAHLTTAGEAFAAAGVAGVIAGGAAIAVGRGGGGRASAGGSTPSLPDAPSGGRRSNGGSGGGSRPRSPISRPTGVNTPLPTGVGGGGGGGTQVFNLSLHSLFPPDADEMMLQLRKQLRRSEDRRSI